MVIYHPRLTVLVAALFALGALLFRASFGIAWMLLAASVLSGFLLLVKPTRRLAWLALVPLLAFVYACNSAPRPAKEDLAQYIGRGVIVTGRVCEKVVSLGIRRSKCIFMPEQMVFPDRRALSGKTELLMDGEPLDLSSGDVVRIAGFVNSPTRPHLAWQADMANLLAKQSVYSTLTASCDNMQRQTASASHSIHVGEVESLIETLRKRILDTHVANLGYEAGSLLTSMVLGERAVAVDSSIINAFRTVGLSHLIAASGFNLTVITAIAYWLARILTGSKLFQTICAMLSMVIFVALAGLSPSVLRAALMCGLVLISKYVCRSLNGMAVLALTLLLSLLIDPAAIVDPGCQLSYAATAGIICGAEPLTNFVSFKAMPKLMRSGVAATAVVIAAQLAIVPIQLYYFWQIGMLFLPANLMVTSMVAPVTVLGFVSSLVGALPIEHTLLAQIPWLLDAIAAYPLKLIIFVAKYFAAFDAAVIIPGPPTLIAVGLYYFALFWLLFSLKTKRWRFTSFVFFCLAGALLFWRPPSAQLTIGVFPRSIVFFGSDRKACVIGEKSYQLSRFLAYNGAHIENRSCVIQKIGGLQFDEITVPSSKTNFAILLLHNAENILDAAKSGPKEDYVRPLCRIAVFELGWRDKGFSEQIASLQKEGAADLIIMIQNDREKNWRQWTTDKSLRKTEGALSESSPCQAFPAITLTVCPHRMLSIMPLNSSRNWLRQ